MCIRDRSNPGRSQWTWWDFRNYLLTDDWSIGPQVGSSYDNYFDIAKRSVDDNLYAFTIDEKEPDYSVREIPLGSEIEVCGGMTDSFGMSGLPEDRPTIQHFPWGSIVDTQGDGIPDTEYPKEWWRIDFDWDLTAEGSDPLSFDTDGDWSTDGIEVFADQESASSSGQRGEHSSPIRCDYCRGI